MLALVIALLSLAVAPSGAPTGADRPADGVAVEALSASDLHAAQAEEACCDTSADPSPEPCPPDEPCAPGGGCCACVSCAKRVADAPTAAPERRSIEAPTERAEAPESTGIDGEEAVWHPPRG